MVEDDDMINSTMNGIPYPVARFAATLRRQLYKGMSLFAFHSDSFRSSLRQSEHLGLIPPQNCDKRHPEVTNAMRPAPNPADDFTHTKEDFLVADPLLHQTDQLWKETARKNREIFTEIFRPVPSNFVQNVDSYDVRVPFL